MKYAPYSFSKINTFFDCQKKFEFTYVNKISVDKEYTDPSYFIRGRFLHAYIADRLKGGNGMKIKGYNIEINDKLNLVEHADTTLENEYIGMTYDFDTNLIESYISLDKKLTPNKIKNKSAISGYIDYCAVQDDYGIIIDWKSGKYKTKQHFTQLEIYSIWLFQKYPSITEIDLVFYYVEHNKFIMKTITPNDIKTLKTDLTNKIDTIENTSSFITNESKYCVQCPFFNTCIDEFNINGF